MRQKNATNGWGWSPSKASCAFLCGAFGLPYRHLERVLTLSCVKWSHFENWFHRYTHTKVWFLKTGAVCFTNTPSCLPSVVGACCAKLCQKANPAATSGYISSNLCQASLCFLGFVQAKLTSRAHRTCQSRGTSFVEHACNCSLHVRTKKRKRAEKAS